MVTLERRSHLRFTTAFYLSVLIMCLSGAIALSGSRTFRIRQFSDFASRYGFASLYMHIHDPIKPVRVAILDDSFDGYQDEIGRSLPRNTFLIKPPVSVKSGSSHGLLMAQIFTAFATDELDRADLEPIIHLIEAGGIENFKRAIDIVINQKVDLVIFGRVFNLDPNEAASMNAEVNRAVAAGVIWVNTAGNFAETVFDYVVGLPDAQGFLPLERNNTYHSVYCVDKLECSAEISLAWADPNANASAEKNLHLLLLDKNGQVVSVSEQHDVHLKRERIMATLPTGHYYLRVHDESRNFLGNEEIRIVVNGNNLRLDNFDEDENLLTPADNPYVITVGAEGLKQSSISKKAKKPDIFTRSRLELEDGVLQGSAVATAIMGARIALLKLANPLTNREQVLVQLGETGVRLNMNAERFAEVSYAASKGGYKVPPQVPNFNPPRSIVIEEPLREPVPTKVADFAVAKIAKESKYLRKIPVKHPAPHSKRPIPVQFARGLSVEEKYQLRLKAKRQHQKELAKAFDHRPIVRTSASIHLSKNASSQKVKTKYLSELDSGK